MDHIQPFPQNQPNPSNDHEYNSADQKAELKGSLDLEIPYDANDYLKPGWFTEFEADSKILEISQVSLEQQ